MKLMFMDYDHGLYSKMAEAIGHRYNKMEHLEILSCGLVRGQKNHKDLKPLMKDIDIEIKNQQFKILDDFHDVDILVTLGRNVDILFIPENAKLTWNNSIYPDDLEKTRDILVKDIKRLLRSIEKNKY